MQLLHIHIPRRVWTFWRDDGEWEEKKHPRGKGGKFAKVGYEVSSKASSLLKSHGYEKQKGAPLFKHPSSGETVMFHPPEKEGAKVSFHWGHYHPEHGELGTGHGLAALHQHLGGQGTASAVAQAGVKHKGAEPAAPAPAAPKPTEAPAAAPPGTNLHPSYTNALKDKGFEFTGTVSGKGIFVNNKTGVHVKLNPPKEGKKSLSEFTVYSPAAFEGHEAGIFGEGMYDLLDAVAEAEKHPVPTPAAPKPTEAPKPAASFAPNAITEKGFSAAQTQYLENKGFKPNPHDPSHYSNEEGVHVYLDKPNDPKNPHNGGYSVYSPQAMAGEAPGDYGKGPLDLAKAVSAASGKAKAAPPPPPPPPPPPAAPVTAPKDIEEVLPVKEQSGDWTYYTAGEYGGESVAVNSKTGEWEILPEGAAKEIKGTGQESFNAEFEKLHPRGPGGKFQAKPGGAEPTQPKVKKSTQVEHFDATSKMPAELNGVAFSKFTPPADWSTVQGQNPSLVETPMHLPPGKHASAGLLIQEPDGRVWIVQPKGGYAGYNYTFPKGSQDSGESLQVAAIREAYEESGLIGEITGVAGDYEGTQSMTRYYFAKRVAGTPTAFGPESSGVSLVPPEQLDQYLNVARDKKIAGTHFPPSSTGQPAKTPQQVVGDPIKLTDLKKVGGTLGTTPGGVYEDTDGNQLYVKLQNEDRTKNEVLAASLASAAGMPTFRYHLLHGGEGQASEMIPIAKEGTASLSPQDLKKVQNDFAIHAWLANWDAAGAGSEKPEMNQGVLPSGEVITLDWGGALAYRGMGLPKGAAWNDTVDEWDSLRSIGKNPTTAKLFGNMTKEQLIQSAKRVTSISDAQIRDLVNKHGPGNADARKAMADRLIARRDAIFAKAKAAEPPKPLSPSELRAKMAEWNPPKKPQGAVTHYKGSGYHPMNALCRFFDLQPNDPSNEGKYIRQITDWLDKASSKEEVTMYRGIKGDYATRVKEVGNLPGAVGRLLSDDGFVSMSTSKSFADNWHAGKGLTLKITIPAGTKMATVYEADHHDVEYESIAQRGTMFRITKWEPYSGTYEVELVQDHLKS